MINGLQVVSHMSLFQIKSPGNVSAFNMFFSEIASIDLIVTEEFTAKLFYFPEFDSVSVNFQNAGFSNPLIIPSLGFLFYLILLHIAMVAVHLLLILLAKAISKT